MKNTLKTIINEEIDRLVLEKEFKSKSKEQSEKAQKKNGNKINAGDEEQIRNDVNNSDLINVAALARLVYPDHTPEGAQSQLRKKLKGIKNDTGSEYHLQQGEAKVIHQALNKI